MRTRSVLLIASLSLPAIVSAQVARPPRVGPRTPTGAAPLPPEAPAVARALAHHRSRWSSEGYTLVTNVQAPAAIGGTLNYSTLGTGTHADYRYTDHFAVTMDLATSIWGGPGNNQTLEFGSRYRPNPWSEKVRSFFDLRGAYMHMYDNFLVPTGTAATVGGVNQEAVSGSRTSRGFGSIAGAGLEFSLTPTWAVTSELSAMRNRMTASTVNGLANVPSSNTYWMSSYRFTLGLKYNGVRNSNLKQTPTQ
jgi:hypothetical protein